MFAALIGSEKRLIEAGDNISDEYWWSSDS